MLRALLALVSAALLLPALAAGGGFATVQLDSLPAGADGNGTWTPTITVLQHGVTPLEDVTPIVRISNGTDIQEFTAVATGEPGQYRAEVVFPSAGTWRYEIDDGFSQTHSYSPVTFAAVGEDGGGIPSWAWIVGAGALAAVALAVLVPVVRRRGGLHRDAAPAGS